MRQGARKSLIYGAHESVKY